METDEDRVDDAVLALLYLTLDRDGRAWKGFDWSVMNRLHDKGMIHNPVGKAKSVLLTEEGIAESEQNIHQDNMMCSTAVSQRKPLRFEMTARDTPLNALSLLRIMGMPTAADALKCRRLSRTFHPCLKLFPIPQSKIGDR